MTNHHGIGTADEIAAGGEQPWIEWAGGECPVGSEQRIQTIFRMESPNDFDPQDCRAGSYAWDHTGGQVDIIAYRVVSA